jgi:hypothetical protein
MTREFITFLTRALHSQMNPVCITPSCDRLCDLLVRVPGYRSRGLGSIPSLSNILRISGSGTGFTKPCEEKLGRKVAALV